jgi:hypothetical protein
MKHSNDIDDKRRQIFISYASADKSIARWIADSLQNAGLKVWFYEWELGAGDSITSRIEEGLQSSDLLLVLLSQHSVSSKWVRQEWTAALSGELKARAVTVIPALIENCRIPLLLADRKYLDLREDLEGGIRQLIQQLKVVPEINFYKLDTISFENLVIDLLVKLGFSIDHKNVSSDSSFDFVASFVSKDPFGAEQRESWLVEVKFYQDERVSLQALRQMVDYMVEISGRHKGLVVTNGQLTSVAEKYQQDIVEKYGQEIRVIGGAELRALLLNYTDLVERYFNKGATE